MNLVLRDDAPLAYCISGATMAPKRLLVLAHGVGGNVDNLESLAVAAPADTAAVRVQAPLAIGPGRYGWFPVTFAPDGPQPELDAAEVSRLLVCGFLDTLQRRLGVPPAATVMAGFSQGGIISASVALTRPELVGGFGILSGRILPELEPRIAAREALAHLRAFIGHGVDDRKLPVAWAQRAAGWLSRLGIENEIRLYPDGHAISPAMQSDMLA